MCGFPTRRIVSFACTAFAALFVCTGLHAPSGIRPKAR